MTSFIVWNVDTVFLALKYSAKCISKGTLSGKRKVVYHWKINWVCNLMYRYSVHFAWFGAWCHTCPLALHAFYVRTSEECFRIEMRTYLLFKV